MAVAVLSIAGRIVCYAVHARTMRWLVFVLDAMIAGDFVPSGKLN